MSLLLGLEIGKRAIMSSQTALNVVGHNMANANTTGYSKQVANLSATTPLSTTSSTSAGQVGTGVNAESITRLRDAYVDGQYRSQNTSAGYWTSTQETLSQVETIINEPSDSGLRSTIDAFWQSWQDLSSNAENEADRAVVAQRGQAVADAFQNTYQQLSGLQDDLNSNVKVDVDQINSLGSQIKALNQQIEASIVAGQQPNDLEDKRDVLVDQLSKIVDIKTSEDQNGMLNVQIGGNSLVQGVEFNALGTKDDSQGLHMVVWADTQVQVQVTGGDIKANLDMRGKTDLADDQQTSSQVQETVPELMEQLNTLAKTIVTKTNELHRQGYSLNNTSGTADGTDFFTMPTGSQDSYTDWAKTMAVNSSIVDDPQNIAAASQRTYDSSGSESNFGDGNMALAIAQLKQDTNSGAASVESSDITLVNNAAISLTVHYGDQDIKVNIASPTYSTAADRATVVADAINTALGSSIVTVSANGNKLDFSSSDSKFKGIDNLSVDDGTGTMVNYGSYSALTIKGSTTDDFWRAVAAQVGVDSKEATTNSTNQDTLVSELDSKRQSTSGVSLDEEATDMIKYQNAFNAASRFITTVDSMLDKLINSTGLVGRG